MTELSKNARDFFRKQGSIGGKKSSSKLTKEQRVERAKKAVQAREAKKKKKPD